MSDQTFHPTDALGAYALGACTPDEADAVATHLAGCADCAAELHKLEIGARALLADVPQMAPPPQVKARLMERVRADAELFAAAQKPRAEAGPRRASLRDRLGGMLRPVPAFAAAAACALAITLVVAGGETGETGPKVIVAKVDGSRAPGADARVVLADDGTRLRVEGMPDPGSNRTYQVWVRAGEDPPRSAGVLFDVDESGRATAELPVDVDEVDQVLVTSEPKGGSAQPTREPVLSAAI